MTREIITTRLATVDDIPAIRFMYDDLKQYQDYPAFRSKSFHRAVGNVIENAKDSEQIIVASVADGQPVGMAHAARPFSIRGSRANMAYELHHLYTDESATYTAPINLVDHIARDIQRTAGSREALEGSSLSISSGDTNCFDTLLAQYPYNGAVSSIRYNGHELRNMALRSISRQYRPEEVIEPAFADLDNVVLPFPSLTSPRA